MNSQSSTVNPHIPLPSIFNRQVSKAYAAIALRRAQLGDLDLLAVVDSTPVKPVAWGKHEASSVLVGIERANLPAPGAFTYCAGTGNAYHVVLWQGFDNGWNVYAQGAHAYHEHQPWHSEPVAHAITLTHDGVEIDVAFRGTYALLILTRKGRVIKARASSTKIKAWAESQGASMGGVGREKRITIKECARLMRAIQKSRLVNSRDL